MTTPIQTLSRYTFNNTSQRWFDNQSGRFVPSATVTETMQSAQDAARDNLTAMTDRLYSGQITLQQWQIGVAAELKDAHLAQSMFAVGGKRNMTQANYGRVGGTLRDEYRYLTNFANDIAAGNVSEAQARARIQQYGNATKQSYWREYGQASSGNIEWVLNPAEHCPDCIDLAGNSPYTAATLPTVPGAGTTQCRGNCRCTLERR